MDGIVDNTDSSVDNEFTGIDLGLSLLDLKERLGNFRVVSDFGKIHALDLNSGDLASGVEHVFKELGNENSVVLERSFVRVVRSEWEFSANSSDDIKTLVANKVGQVVTMIQSFNR